jgi:GDSL-like lipase/acylhydrolase family protein
MLVRDYGMAWGLGGWLVMNFMQQVGPAIVAKLKERIASELRTTFLSKYWDATDALALEGAQPTRVRTPVSAVLVASSAYAETIVAFGDSITDGGITDTPDVRGWPGHLAKRLLQASGPPYAVANEGIGGNGIVTDIIDPNGLARFDRDDTIQAIICIRRMRVTRRWRKPSN